MTRETKALIFDFGGVLTSPVWESFAAFCTAEELDPEAVLKLFREDPDALAELRRLEMGVIEEAEFERLFAARLGVDSDSLIDRLFAGMTLLEPMIDAVRSARQGGLKTGLLSNSWSVSHYDRDLMAELFDAAVISGEVGMHKPQPEIYLLAVERLGVEPSDCVFIDDLRENCDGAEAVGMSAIRHRDPAETIANLEELTAVSLS